MAWRFRRSIRIAPGIRMNVGTRGVSWSLGPRGASINVSRRGTYVNASIPGTGLYSRERIGTVLQAARKPSQSLIAQGAPTQTLHKIKGEVTEDGFLALSYENGSKLTPEHHVLCLKQHKESLLDLLQREADERSRSVDELAVLHEKMPDARKPVRYEPLTFGEEPPSRPFALPPKQYGLLARLVRHWRARVDAENEKRAQANAESLAQWHTAVAALEARRQEHERTQEQLRRLFEHEVRLHVEAMDKALEMRLQSIDWPRETVVTFDLRDSGKLVLLDVDLPEIEDMPTHGYSVLKREMRLTTKDLSEKRIREVYMRHIHAVGVRLIGELFATLPTCERAVLSAYSQRTSKRTGHTEDQYLYSVRVSRDQWLTLNFDDAAKIDPVAVFDAFDLRRRMSKTGVFTPIEPFNA
jgi:hypothetical protein